LIAIWRIHRHRAIAAGIAMIRQWRMAAGAKRHHLGLLGIILFVQPGAGVVALSCGSASMRCCSASR
jgi:hypothetical protein